MKFRPLRHPISEHPFFPLLSKTKYYQNYLQYNFPWCACSEPFAKVDTPSKSQFLTTLMQDVTDVTCPMEFLRELLPHYLCLRKDIDAYEANEDEYIKRAREHLRIPISNRSSIYEFIQNDLDLEPEYHYLLMNYLDNAGYMDHGVAIRCGWGTTSNTADAERK